MPQRPCLTCGRLVAGSYCERHDPERKRRRDTPGRGGGRASSRFRSVVLARAGHRCEWVGKDGVRCTATMDLEAHHLRAIRAGGDPHDAAGGVALCRRHHRIAERLTQRQPQT